MELGQRIKKTREEQGISQTELAQKTCLSKQTIYKYENSIVTNIPSDKIESIAKVLNVTPAYLMGWEDISVINTNNTFNICFSASSEEKEIEALRPLFDKLGLSLSTKTDFDDNGKIKNVSFSLQNSDYFYNFSYNELKALKENIFAYSKFQVNELLSNAENKTKK